MAEYQCSVTAVFEADSAQDAENQFLEWLRETDTVVEVQEL